MASSVEIEVLKAQTFEKEAEDLKRYLESLPEGTKVMITPIQRMPYLLDEPREDGVYISVSIDVPLELLDEYKTHAAADTVSEFVKKHDIRRSVLTRKEREGLERMKAAENSGVKN